MLDPQEVYLQSGDPKTEQVAHIYEEYRKELRKANALDFDDLLLETVRLLKAVPAVRDYYNRRFQYVMIDEYQDTNRPQYELMRLLAGHPSQHLRRGRRRSVDLFLARRRHPQHSGVRKGLSRSQDHPPGTELPLDAEHSAGGVGGGREQLKRKGKNLWTSRQGGTKIGYYEAPDGENEALFVADYISKYLREAVEQGENAARRRALPHQFAVAAV